MKLTITQYDGSNGVLSSAVVLSTITVSLPAPATVKLALAGSISGPQGAQGPQGATGAQGPQGEQGEPGLSGSGGGVTVVFAQAIPLASWVIAHGLNRYPSVEVVDSSGRTVEGDVQFDSSDQLTVSFTAAFSGSAYLN